MCAHTGGAHSFIDLLDRLGRQWPPSMPYSPGSDLAAWKSRILEKLVELRGRVPDRVEPLVETVSSVATDTHVRHRLEIAVSEFSRLPAYLLVPHDLREGQRRPGILALHGHAERGMDTIAAADDPDADVPMTYGRQAVDAGYVVLCPAWWGWPGRDGHVGCVGTRDKCNVIQMAASMYGLSVLGLHIQDGQAALDVLSQRPEVDPARIGCIGNSYGGRTAMWLSAFDERVRATVASGCVNVFRERSLKLVSCAIQYFHGMMRYCDVDDVFCLLAPRALQLMAGAVDPLLNERDREATFAKVRAAYAAAGAPDALECTVHPGGHWMEWPLAHAFLARRLGDARGGGQHAAGGAVAR
jgi:dienelactone hydrolase